MSPCIAVVYHLAAVLHRILDRAQRCYSQACCSYRRHHSLTRSLRLGLETRIFAAWRRFVEGVNHNHELEHLLMTSRRAHIARDVFSHWRQKLHAAQRKQQANRAADDLRSQRLMMNSMATWKNALTLKAYASSLARSVSLVAMVGDAWVAVAAGTSIRSGHHIVFMPHGYLSMPYVLMFSLLPMQFYRHTA